MNTTKHTARPKAKSTMTAAKKADTRGQAVQAKAKAKSARKADPVVHFELPLDDPRRISNFYQQAFGWKTQMLGEEHGNYILATTTDEVDKIGSPKKGGIINGGFYTRDENKPAQFPSVVIGVDSIKDAMKRIEKAGGEVLGTPEEIPGFGTYVAFFDTEGNRLSIIEPTMEMKEKEKKRK